jgi:hypothetical protein
MLVVELAGVVDYILNADACGGFGGLESRCVTTSSALGPVRKASSHFRHFTSFWPTLLRDMPASTCEF